MALHLLGAGASKGLVAALRPGFTAATGSALASFFSAVGVIRDRLLAGEPCDVVILSAALLAQPEVRQRLAAPPRPIGLVRTGVAVPEGQPPPPIATAPQLATALAAATALYIPDPEASTAGIHVMRVLRALGLAETLAPRLRAFPNGETAMRVLGEEAVRGAIGCTQVTEIRYTPGLTLVGPLPEPHGLATVYAAAVVAGTAQPAAAQALVERLTGPAGDAARLAGGFEPVAPDAAVVPPAGAGPAGAPPSRAA